jgi:hypothetical protein
VGLDVGVLVACGVAVAVVSDGGVMLPVDDGVVVVGAITTGEGVTMGGWMTIWHPASKMTLSNSAATNIANGHFMIVPPE